MKKPELVLDYQCEINEEFIFNKIKEYDFIDKNVYKNQGFEVCRIGGYQYKANDDGSCEMVGWQCNFASIQNYDIQLPTIITIKTDSSNVITEIHLTDKFKGSQGIPCSQKYLARRLQEFVGQEFSKNNEKLSNDLGTGCRHTFEVLFGACVFKDWCENQELKSGYLSETTAAFHDDDLIIACDRNCVNGKETVTKIQISDFKNTIAYDKNGAICGCKGMKVEGFSANCRDLMIDEELLIGESKTITSDNKNDFSLKLLKILSKFWKNSGKEIGIKNKFYFSHLWPTTLYGILVQVFAMVVFSDSYAYFQHCIRGLQKDEEHCACIGVCEDIVECEKYFPDFTMEDLY